MGPMGLIFGLIRNKPFKFFSTLVCTQMVSDEETWWFWQAVFIVSSVGGEIMIYQTKEVTYLAFEYNVPITFI